ncbi:TolC family protein [Thermodesulforhabdus norvegica]|uniref:Outer membrane protein TolC n=1 Tax=Thermodesulforhabdus norvegica TaxID=39841 RepID=A0A1I4SPW0_9BACT|nr:TolC family protein [Thermodesulforhabdus norvegica]SFM66472.1 Outer membrane protein TolC [Thermodesulforhabdus norvegica]
MAGNVRVYLVIALILSNFFLTFITPSRATETLTLDRAIEEAIANNSIIKQAIERQRAATEAVKSARADFLPKFSAQYSYTHLKDAPYSIFTIPFIPAPTMKVAVGNRDTVEWYLRATQPIFTGFALITKLKMANLELDTRQMEREQAILDVARDVKVAYFRLLLAEHYLDVAGDEVSALKAHEKDAERFYEQGLIPHNDLLKSRVARAQSEQKLEVARSNLEIARAALNSLLQRDLLDPLHVEDIRGVPEESFTLEGLFSEALEKRPEVKLLKLAVHKTDLAADLAKSEYYPKVYAVAQYAQEGEGLLASSNDYQNDHNFAVGVNITWNFFEWGKTYAEVNKWLREKKALEYSLEEAIKNIKLQVKDAYEKLLVARKNIITAESALEQARENFRITNLQYQQNVTTSTEVLDARTFLTQAEVNYYNALYGYHIARAELERAVGRK